MMSSLAGLALMLGQVLGQSAPMSLPGVRLGDMGRPSLMQRDLHELVTMLELSGAEAQAAHEALGVYMSDVQQRARTFRERIYAIQMPTLASMEAEKASRRAHVRSVQQDIERRRAAGEFDDDPEAMRRELQAAIDAAHASVVTPSPEELALVRDVFSEQAGLIQQWHEGDQASRASVLAALAQIAGEARADRFLEWQDLRVIEDGVRRARLAGERMNVLDLEVDAAEARQAWRAEHARLLEHRDAQLRDHATRVGRAIGTGSWDAYRRAVRSVWDARAAVRDHALAGVAEMAEFVEEPDAIDAFHRRAFPEVWRRTRAARAVRAVLTWSDLDPATRALVEGVQFNLEQDDAELRRLEQQATIDEEVEVRYRADLDAGRHWFPDAQPTPEGRSVRDRIAARRQAIDAEAMAMLREILGEDRWSRVPGGRSAPVSD